MAALVLLASLLSPPLALHSAAVMRTPTTRARPAVAVASNDQVTTRDAVVFGLGAASGAAVSAWLHTTSADALVASLQDVPQDMVAIGCVAALPLLLQNTPAAVVPAGNNDSPTATDESNVLISGRAGVVVATASATVAEALVADELPAVTGEPPAVTGEPPVVVEDVTVLPGPGVVVATGQWVRATYKSADADDADADDASDSGWLKATYNNAADEDALEDSAFASEEDAVHDGDDEEQMDAVAAVTLEVTVGAGADALELVYVRDEGIEREMRVYAVLSAGETYSQPSFARDTWIVRDRRTRRVLRRIELQSWPAVQQHLVALGERARVTMSGDRRAAEQLSYS